MLQVPNSLVSVAWLNDHLGDKNLIVLDATISKVTDPSKESTATQIPGARFFDLKNKFSTRDARFPNTFPSEKQFTEQAQQLGINRDSAIVVYDDKGIYSSARVWWMFKTFGHGNVAVLDGGLPEWVKQGCKIEGKQQIQYSKGNFKAEYHKEFMLFFEDMTLAVQHKTHNIIDARSEARFYGHVPEPREGLRSGHIPSALSLPFVTLQQNGVMKKPDVIKAQMQKLLDTKKTTVFTCGSGITACVLALGAELSGIENIAVYDGSWTEWGTLTKN